MIRVNARELNAVFKFYPTIETKRTRHNVYIMNIQGKDLNACMNIINNQLSNRQKKDLYWIERRQHQNRE